MIKYLEQKFALSHQGAINLRKGILLSALQDLSFMLPVGLVVMLLTTLIDAVSRQMFDVDLPTYGYLAIGLLLFVIMGLINGAQYNSVYISTYNESARRRIELAEKLRILPLSFFAHKDLADLTGTIMGDCADLEKAFSHAVPQIFGSTIALTIVSIPLFFMHWQMALALFWVVPISILLVISVRKIQKKYHKIHFEHKRETSDLLQEGLECMQEIKSGNGEKRYLETLDKQLNITEESQTKAQLSESIVINITQVILKLGLVTLLLFGSTLLIQGTISPILFFIFLIVASRIYDPFISIFEYFAHITSVQSQIGRMNEIINYPVQEGQKGLIPNGFEIDFKDVVFGYNDDRKVLDGVSFVARQGEVTALVGPSGSGKSTAAKLAARFWDINSGQITIGGLDIQDFDPEELLKYYAIVFQDVTLFNTTLRENIRIGKLAATDEEIIEVAHTAGCDEFIKRLPKGLDTVIGENGATISGGERQRISIARALLKDAPIILLDEASASLDVENETKIQEAISHLIKDKTVIIIAHRMRTISNANKIIVLEDGHVVQQGNHQQLSSEEGLYRHLIDSQIAHS